MESNLKLKPEAYVKCVGPYPLVMNLHSRATGMPARRLDFGSPDARDVEPSPPPALLAEWSPQAPPLAEPSHAPVPFESAEEAVARVKALLQATDDLPTPKGMLPLTPPPAAPPVPEAWTEAVASPAVVPFAFEEHDHLPDDPSPSASPRPPSAAASPSVASPLRTGTDSEVVTTGGQHARPAPIPPALLALPRPVLAAAMRQQSRALAKPSATPVDSASRANDKQARAARRQWVEQAKLLQQRVYLLERDFLPQSLLAEHEVAEAVAPVLAEAAERLARRTEEAVALREARQRAVELTRRFGGLVSHIGAGGQFLDELQQVMHGAESELSELRARHAAALERLMAEEADTSGELDSLTRRFEQWELDDAATPLAAARATPTTDGGRRVRERRPPSSLTPVLLNGLPGELAEGSPISGVTPHGIVRAAAPPSAPSAAPPHSRPCSARRSPADTPADTLADLPAPLAATPLPSAAGGTPRAPVGFHEGVYAEGATHAHGGSASALYREVSLLDELLVRLGGTDCGWEAQDHAMFQRLRTQMLRPGGGSARAAPGPHDAPAGPAERNGSGCARPAHLESEYDARVAAFIERASREIPAHDAASVAAHERVVVSREAAVARRRELLAEWRSARDAEARAAREVADRDVAALAAKSARRQRGRPHDLQEEQHRQAELQAWRERKVKEHEAKLAAEQAVKLEAAHRAAADEARRRQIKDALSKRSMQRAEEEAARRRREERERREAVAGSALSRKVAMLAMQHRDAAEADRRKVVAELRLKEKREREGRLEELVRAARPPEVANTRRDMQRLLKPTAAAEARAKETAEVLEVRSAVQGGVSKRGSGSGSSVAGPRSAASAKAVPSRFATVSLTFKAAGSRAQPSWRSGVL